MVICLACAGCSGNPGEVAAAPAANGAPGCIPGGDGFLQARLRGALDAEVHWDNAALECDGGPRPDEKGLRVAFAADLPGSTHRLRFIFGIDEHDVADGVAQALPTNLTVIIEGEDQIFATRGSERCAVEGIERSELVAAGQRMYRVHARGYCLGPATSLTGDERLLVPTFEFTGIAAAEQTP
jgi:hypothetical protein